MKKMFLLLALLMPMLVFTSCSDDDDDFDQSALYGIWMSDDSDYETLALNIKEDGTAEWVCMVGSSITDIRTYTWHATSEEITFRDRQTGIVETNSYTLSGEYLYLGDVRYKRYSR